MEEAWIETVSGRKFTFLSPKDEDIDINDIAHALSMTCRYSGHVRQFYSVAEHSYLASFLVPPEDALGALLHDASEAYITDVASPIKSHLHNYKKLEDTIMQAIANKYGFTYPVSAAIKKADVAMLSTEAHWLMPGKGDNWTFWNGVERPDIYIGIKPSCLSPEQAKKYFIERFNILCEGK